MDHELRPDRMPWRWLLPTAALALILWALELIAAALDRLRRR